MFCLLSGKDVRSQAEAFIRVWYSGSTEEVSIWSQRGILVHLLKEFAVLGIDLLGQMDDLTRVTFFFNRTM